MSLEDLSPEERRAFNLGKLLLSNPEVRNASLRLAKKADPNLQLPEIDLELRMEAQEVAFNKKLEERDTRDMERRVSDRKKERDREILAAGFKVEDIEAIIVRERCTYETAMKIAGMEQQLAEPSAADIAIGGNAPGMPVEMRPEKDWRSLAGSDLRKKSASIASDMIKEFRSRAGRPAR